MRRRHKSQRRRAHPAADRVVRYAMLGLSVNLRGLAFDGHHHDHRAARGRADPGGRRQRRQQHAQDRRRAAAQIRGPQFRQRGSLFLDRPGAARDPAARRNEAFGSRLASPPTDGRYVLVRFFTRHDIIAGTRYGLRGTMSRILIAEDEDALCDMSRARSPMDGHEVKPRPTAARRSTCSHARGSVRSSPHRRPHAEMDGIALSLAGRATFPTHYPVDDRLRRPA